MVYRQWLHFIIPVVHDGFVFQYGFIDRACHRKFETRVVPQLHVCKVLVGKHLQNHRRYGGESRFAVVAVPHRAPSPINIECAADVTFQAGQDHICQITRSIAGQSRCQSALIEVRGVDAQ